VSDIEHCKRCEEKFLGDGMLQTEVRHELVKLGEEAARRVMLERLESFHEGHDSE